MVKIFSIGKTGKSGPQQPRREPAQRAARRTYQPGEREALLIGILRGTAPGGVQMHERYDAASDLEDFPSDEVTAALTEIASDAQEDETLVALCAESLAGIWIARGAVERDVLARLLPWGRREVEQRVARSAPELLTSQQDAVAEVGDRDGRTLR
ncbi:hypothetical protein [Kitasatospora aureofaciens]|uniref:hypothetical protein n=1 Tax=Kitasatospora aureofaciens TaxID=1894 RepID=UPI0033C30151